MTTPNTSAVVACRVLGLYIALRWLGLMHAEAFSLFRGPPLAWLSLGAAVSLVVPVLVAVGLWMRAPWIAKRMLADVESGQAPRSAITLQEAQTVAISILGLLFVVEAIPGLAVAVLEYFRVPGIAADAGMRSALSAGALKATVMRITEIARGTCLILGSRGLAGVLQTGQASRRPPSH